MQYTGSLRIHLYCIIYDFMLKKQTGSDGKKSYRILSYKVPNGYIYLLFFTIINLFAVGLITFWDEYLLDKSHICSTDPQFACFPVFPNMDTPQLDCSNTSYLKNNKIDSVVCFNFVFRLGSATGSALGTISTIVLIICPIQLILLKVSNGSEWNKRRVISTVAIQIFTVITTLVFGFGHSFLEFQISSTKEENLITILTNTLVVLTIIMGTISFSMTYCAKAYEQRKQRRIESKEQKNDSDNNEEHEQHEEHNKLAYEEREKYE